MGADFVYGVLPSSACSHRFCKMTATCSDTLSRDSCPRNSSVAAPIEPQVLVYRGTGERLVRRTVRQRPQAARNGRVHARRLDHGDTGIAGLFPLRRQRNQSVHIRQVGQDPAGLPSTMQSAQDRSDTSIPAKYSISNLPCSQSSCDPIGSSTSQQRAAQLRMLRARSCQVNCYAAKGSCGVSCRHLLLPCRVGKEFAHPAMVADAMLKSHPWRTEFEFGMV